MTAAAVPGTGPSTGPDAADLYALGSNPDESARLRRQSDELRLQSAELLGRIGLEPGQSDAEHALCCPPLPAWDRLREIFTASHDRLGADLRIGRRLPELFRESGLMDIEVAHAPVYLAGHSRRDATYQARRSAPLWTRGEQEI